MGLIYLNYDCHEGAIVMRKKDGTIFRVRGNVSMWDMTLILVPVEGPDDPTSFEDSGCVTANPKTFKRDFLVLDVGEDRLSAALRAGLSQIAK